MFLSVQSLPAKDITVNPFFDELFKHWNVRLRPGTTAIAIEVDDSDDESTDFTEFLDVKHDPYMLEASSVKADVKLEGCDLAPVVAPVPPVAPMVSPKTEVIELNDDTPSPAVPSQKEVVRSLSAAELDERIAKVKFLAQDYHIIIISLERSMSWVLICPHMLSITMLKLKHAQYIQVYNHLYFDPAKAVDGQAGCCGCFRHCRNSALGSPIA